MINIDTVYQKVLAIANKEQRGYITPQEYNLLANQAQMQIFESYFYTKDRREKIEANKDDAYDETYITELMSKKLNPFTTVEDLTSGHTYPTSVSGNQVFQTGKIWFNNRVCQYVTPLEAQRLIESKRHIAFGRDPFYTDNSVTQRDVIVYSPSTHGSTAVSVDVQVECIVRPTPVAWAYVVVQEKALYNSNLAVDFLLHVSEEDTLVNTILELAGIITNKAELVQVASSRNQIETQTQNQ